MIKHFLCLNTIAFSPSTQNTTRHGLVVSFPLLYKESPRTTLSFFQNYIFFVFVSDVTAQHNTPQRCHLPSIAMMSFSNATTQTGISFIVTQNLLNRVPCIPSSTPQQMLQHAFITSFQNYKTVITLL